MYSTHGYNFSLYRNTGKEHNKTIGKQHVGNLSLKYLFEDEDEEDEEEKFNLSNSNAIRRKISNSLAMVPSDSYFGNNVDRGTSTKNVGGLGSSFLQEFAGDHKNPVRKGMSPFKQPKRSGPPIGTGGSFQAFRTSGNKIDLGSRKGWAKPYFDNSIDDHLNFFSLKSLIDNTDIDTLQFRRQKNKIKSLLKEINF